MKFVITLAPDAKTVEQKQHYAKGIHADFMDNPAVACHLAVVFHCAPAAFRNSSIFGNPLTGNHSCRHIIFRPGYFHS